MNTIDQSTVKLFGAMLGFGLWIAAGLSAHATLVTENFTTDPGWVGVNNTANANSYQWSNTDNTGPVVTGAGEAGGLFTAATVESYYADTFGTPVSLNDDLEGAGRFFFDNNNTYDLTIQTGHRSSSTVSPSFLGMTIRSADSLSNPLFRWDARIVLDDGTLLNAGDPVNVAEGQHTFNYTYDPSVGFGQLTVQVDALTPQVISLTSGQRAIGATFDAWGIGMPNSGETVGDANFFIDDVIYTAPIPEPSTILLLATGTLLCFRRRSASYGGQGRRRRGR